MPFAANSTFQTKLWAILFGAFILLAVLPAGATEYSYDDGVIDAAVSVPGYSFGNLFTINGDSNQYVQALSIKQPEYDDYLGGLADFYVWTWNSITNQTADLLGQVLGVSIPQGTSWTNVDFASQNIALTPNSKIFAGFQCTSTYALYDLDGGANSYRNTGTLWAQYGPGDLMLRLHTEFRGDPTPTPPTSVTITPRGATLGDRLRANASGSTNPDSGNEMSYEYQWAKRPAGGVWGGYDIKASSIGPDKLALGDSWKLRARSKVTGHPSAWVESQPVTIQTLFARTIPQNSAVNCQRRGFLQVNFRWPMVESTVLPRFTVTPAGGTPIAGQLEWIRTGVILRFTPAKALAQNTVYTVTVAKGCTRRGPYLVNVDNSFSFTTGGMPIPLSVSPKGQTVPTTAKVVVNFDKPIGSGSVDETTFTVTPAGGTPIAGTFSVVDKRVTFTPSTALLPGTKYTVWLSGQIATPTGRIMGRPLTWSFKTAPAASPALTVSASATPTRGGATQITVNLTSAAATSVEVTNLAGRTVSMLPARDLPAGVSTLLWDGRTKTGTLAPAGRYFARVQAANQSGSQVSCQTAFQR